MWDLNICHIPSFGAFKNVHTHLKRKNIQEHGQRNEDDQSALPGSAPMRKARKLSHQTRQSRTTSLSSHTEGVSCCHTGNQSQLSFSLTPGSHRRLFLTGGHLGLWAEWGGRVFSVVTGTQILGFSTWGAAMLNSRQSSTQWRNDPSRNDNRAPSEKQFCVGESVLF